MYAMDAEEDGRWAKGAGRTPVGIQPSFSSSAYSQSKSEFFPIATQER
jgi:hypothetical protein